MKKKSPSKPPIAKKLLVGITGGIGSGKSSVATVFREAGYPVFSADEIAREIVDTGSSALGEIRSVFGPESIRPDGTLDRAFVRAKIAADTALRLKLEAITHPRIQARSQELANDAFAKGATLVFYEAPLLFEARSDREMDKVICVHADEEKLIARAMKRDGSTRAQIEKLLASQIPQAEKIRRSDYRIENNGSVEELEKKAMALLEQLKKLAG